MQRRVTSKAMLSVGSMIIVSRPDQSKQNPCGIINTIKNGKVSFTDPITKQVHNWSMADMGVEPYEVDEEHPFWGTYLIIHEQVRTRGHWQDTCASIVQTVKTHDMVSLLQ